MVCGSANVALFIRQRKMRFFVSLVILVLVVFTVVTLAAVVDRPRPSESKRNDKELKLVHAIFRHGIRTPADTYPNDIYVNHTFHPYGWGHITNKGRNLQFSTGQYLRKRYDDFLGSLFYNDLVYARSTESERAFMSCALALAGLFPTKGTELDWNPNLNWSPIPIKSEPINEDTLLLARKNCPRYFEELENVFKSVDVKRIFSDNENLMKELTEITGMPINTPDDVQSLYSTLKAEEEFGLTLPDWTKSYYPDKMIPLTETSFILNVYNDELKRLKGGPLLKKVITDWSEKAANKLSPKTRKLFVFTGHDSTISNFLLALGAWERQIPEYGIMILLELYEDIRTKEYGVEVYLKKPSESDAKLLKITGCEEHCPLSKVIELTKHVVPVNWSEECKSKNPDFVTPPPSGP
ncbi:venom acid phosphatase Acph-1-like [Arctopsyche grandis]|uniref:venom acid phosphatase Acph-1-like n=1 Tax=Arctopsyche grandis TaxID=121162 RepID=UPI00406DA166